jgi:hypothetical protein
MKIVYKYILGFFDGGRKQREMTVDEVEAKWQALPH